MEGTTKVLPTKHYLERAKERAGFNEKMATKILTTVITRGITADNCHWSSDRRFMKQRDSENYKAYAHNGMCYIFDKDLEQCITVIPLPKDFGKKKSTYSMKRTNDPRYLRRQQFSF